MRIDRINTYDDNRFSQEALYQHGCYIVDGDVPVEIKIISQTEAIIKGEEAYFQDSNIVWFKHDDRVDNSFLKCIYEIVKWSGIEGSTIKRLYNDNFLKTEFSMPKVAEQQQIGMYFQSLDHLITLHHRKYTDTLKAS